jgi:hypothetical protein
MREWCGGKVYKALQRAEQELHRFKPEAVTITDQWDQSPAPALQPPDAPLAKEYERLQPPSVAYKLNPPLRRLC